MLIIIFGNSLWITLIERFTMRSWFVPCFKWHSLVVI
jgi:hypothetical protein